ncbi:GNAT family N-acetyltransferase [Dactylosporangium salmoneum]|uniref:N-acetyltransferase domain-containing protein n=1 Tax=Dactylosporangium salmoneum TaxID=53361 RepID=A0ABN3FVK5_9ACTN
MTRAVVWGDEPLPPGARVLLRLALLAQRLDDPATLAACAAIATGPAPGYDIVRWRDRAPDRYAGDLGAVLDRLLDAPGAHLQMPARDWGAAEVRAWEAGHAGALLVTAAVHGGRLVAATVAVVPGGAEEAEQHDTAVLPEHRGRGLARRVKAAQALWLREQFPAVRQVTVTVNQENLPMLAVNRAIGYRTVRERLLVEWD